MKKKIFSLAEITDIENTIKYNHSSIGIAASELQNRLEHNYKDEETLIRFLFFSWYQVRESGNIQSGFSKELPRYNYIMEKYSAIDKLSDESKFIIAILGYWNPFDYGQENIWKNKAIELFSEITPNNPDSLLYKNWKFFVDEDENIYSTKDDLRNELHARFFYRGYLGEYFIHMLFSMLEKAKVK